MTATAVSVKTGQPSPPNVDQTTCQKLEARNEAVRGQLANDPSPSIQGAFGPQGATTVAHGSLNGGAPIGAASRLLPGRYANLAQGLWANPDREARKKMRASGRSNLCPEPPFTYGQAFRPHQSHCESKILETLFAPGGTPPSGTLTLNINWQHSLNPNDKLPCRACKELLCHAQEHCKIKIERCEEDPADPPTPVTC